MSPDNTRVGPPPLFGSPITALGAVWEIGADGTIYYTVAPASRVKTVGHATSMWWLGGKLWALSPKSPFHWWEVLGFNQWRDSGTATDPVPVVVPPPPATGSPDGTMVPPAASIITANGDVFTLGALYPAEPDMRIVLRNGVGVDRGGVLYFTGGVVWFTYYKPGIAPQWWVWDPIGLKTVLATGSPVGFYMAPIKSFPDPLPLAVGVPTLLLPYVRSMLPLVWDVVDTPQVSVSVDGKITAKVAGNSTVSSFYDDGH